MRALVIYESMFGNTRAVAERIGAGLARHVAVDVVEVGEAARHVDSEVDLLVVGGPTHAFGLSRPGTRADATKRLGGAHPVSRGTGIREWLGQTGGVIPGTHAAAFGTKIDKRFVPSSAARQADHRLRALGFAVVDAPHDFFVTDVAGPLRDGELDRAHAWGDHLGTLVEQHQPATS